ncbi:MAG: TonB-dependent receptor, partial [Acidobacteria bacterium]|nr:TonB-dependent receptor [Acidobacteriota bacterium]
MRRHRFFILTLIAILALAATSAYAQNAQIIGSLKDQTGGVLPGATVTAKNQDNGLVRSAVADEGGSYRVQALPPGTYTVTAELQGFGTETRADLVLVIDQTATIHFMLKPATVSESITVTGESPLVDTTSSAVSTSVTNEQIQDLPVATRRWLDLAMLTPGTSQDAIRGQFYRGNVNVGAGLREYSNGFVVDGVNNTWAEMGEARQNFGMDSIREFKVSTSTFKAEYGLATGGLVTVVTKSGTNQLHGSGLMFFRDKSLTARDYFQATKPDYRRYQLGGTIGGPIVKDKTHFFATYERTDETLFLTVNSRGLWPQYEGTFESKQPRWTYLAKGDHQLNRQQSLFFRWAAEDEYRPINNAGGTRSISAAQDFAVPRSSAVVGHTWILSSRVINEVRFQYAFAKYQVAPPNSHGDWEPGDFGESRSKYCTPVFTYPTLTLGGCGNSQMGPETRWEIKDDYSFIGPDWGGTHQFKTGADFSYITFQFDNMGSPLGSWSFPKDAPYNPNDRTTWPTQYTNNLPTYGDIPVTHLSTYFQDDWTMAHNLTLNLGLRYDIQFGAFNENIPGLQRRIADKLGPGFGYPLPIPFLEGSDKRGDRNNFGPRAGVAWDPKGDGVTNVHAAYGMFYDNARTLQNGGELTWPQSKRIVINNPPFPDPLGGRSRDQFVSTAPPNITVYANDVVNAYAHQFSVGFSRTLRPTLALTVDGMFVWRYSDRETIDPNLPDRVTRVRPYPQFNQISFGQSTADNRYKALLVKLEKRLSDRYQFLVSYTLAKAVDENFTNALADRYGYFKLERNGAADRRHRLVFSGIVQLPADVQVSAIGDFRSNLPFSPSTSLDLNLDGYTGDLPAGVLPGTGCRDLNLDAINTFRAGRGLAAVSNITCSNFMNVDIRLSKSIRLPQNHRLELIAQLF